MRCTVVFAATNANRLLFFMTYFWKKHFCKSLTIGTILLSASTMVQAAPDPNDALEQLIKQRQQMNQPQAAPAATPAPAAKQQINYNFIQPRPTQAANNSDKADKKPAGKPVTAAQALSIFKPRPTVGTSNMSRGDADSLISSAMGFIGVAYRFGGTTPRGFDCSGFMQYVFRKTFAVNIPRTAAAQATVGSHVSRGNLQPGDMVFFRTAGPRRISHVGMYVGNDRFIHAPRTGKRIEITSLSNKYWSSKYATARRVKRQGADRFISG